MGIRALRIADCGLRIGLTIGGLTIDGLAIGDWGRVGRLTRRPASFNRQSTDNQQSTITSPSGSRQFVNRQSAVINPAIGNPAIGNPAIRNPQSTIRNG
jgi:hypothetical protein